MNVMVSHIYREGNDIVDCLANLGTNTEIFFLEPPVCIVNSLHRNKLGLPNFRFTSF
jgi:hypothetical protein